MRLVGDGAVERVGVSGVAAALGFSERHLNRIVTDELGAGVLAIARAQRAQTARILLETTQLPITEVAWAAGFGSVRAFNDTVRGVFGATPSALRAAAPRLRGQPDLHAPTAAEGALRTIAAHPGTVGPGASPTTLTVRLAARPPFEAAEVLSFLGARVVAGCEAWDGSTYRRSLALPHGHATLGVSAAGPAAVRVELRLADLRDLAPAVARVRRMLDLDADPQAVTEVLGLDPTLAALVAARPGLRVPGCPDPAEVLVRAIVGQQVSVAGARTVISGLVRAHGRPLAFGDDHLDRVFPDAATLAALDPAVLPMPRSRARTLIEVNRALADGELVLDPGIDREAARARLEQFPGIGPWTSAYIALRGLGDPDVMLASDLGVRRAMAALGQDSSASAIEERSAAWRPWRSYAVAHLWTSLVSTTPSDSARASDAHTATPSRAMAEATPSLVRTS